MQSQTYSSEQMLSTLGSLLTTIFTYGWNALLNSKTWCYSWFVKVLRRNSFEVLASMLELAEEGKRQTEIMYQCNINYLTTVSNIDFLMQKGMLEVNLPYYQTTNKGAVFMRKFREIERLMGPGNGTDER